MRLAVFFAVLWIVFFGYSEAEIDSLSVNSEIRSRFAATEITGLVRNPDEDAREFFFSLRLPAPAYISNFTMDINGQIIVSEVKEGPRAKDIYEEAKRRGQSAGHLTKSSRDTNRFQVAVNLAPQSVALLALNYQEILQRAHGVYKHVISIEPEASLKELEMDVVLIERRPISILHVPSYEAGIGQKTNLELLQIPSSRDVIISSNRLQDGTSMRQIHLSSRNGFAGGQLVVLYDVERALDGGDIEVVDGYFVHFLAPRGLVPSPKHVVFALDSSASMQGRKFQQVKTAMKVMLEDLQPDDLFNIIMFNDVIRMWQRRSMDASLYNIQHALNFVEQQTTFNLTNVYAALKESLNLLNQESLSARVPMVLFLTDGQPTRGERNAEKILQSITRANPSGFSIHTMAFGNKAASGLLQRIATNNVGIFRKIYEDADADLQLTGFYKEISSPLLNNVQVRYLNPTIDVDSLVYGQLLDNYYDGGEMMICGKISQDEPVHAAIAGQGQTGQIYFSADSLPLQPMRQGCAAQLKMGKTGNFDQQSLSEDYPCRRGRNGEQVASPQSVGGFIERMWAYLTIKKLIDQIKQRALTVEATAEAEERALELSLKYNFVTELTSMVITVPTAEFQLSNRYQTGGGQRMNQVVGGQRCPCLAGEFPPPTGQFQSFDRGPMVGGANRNVGQNFAPQNYGRRTNYPSGGIGRGMNQDPRGSRSNLNQYPSGVQSGINQFRSDGTQFGTNTNRFRGGMNRPGRNINRFQSDRGQLGSNVNRFRGDMNRYGQGMNRFGRDMNRFRGDITRSPMGQGPNSCSCTLFSSGTGSLGPGRSPTTFGENFSGTRYPQSFDPNFSNLGNVGRSGSYPRQIPSVTGRYSGNVPSGLPPRSYGTNTGRSELGRYPEDTNFRNMEQSGRFNPQRLGSTVGRFPGNLPPRPGISTAGISYNQNFGRMDDRFQGNRPRGSQSNFDRSPQRFGPRNFASDSGFAGDNYPQNFDLGMGMDRRRGTVVSVTIDREPNNYGQPGRMMSGGYPNDRLNQFQRGPSSMGTYGSGGQFMGGAGMGNQQPTFYPGRVGQQQLLPMERGFDPSNVGGNTFQGVVGGGNMLSGDRPWVEARVVEVFWSGAFDRQSGNSVRNVLAGLLEDSRLGGSQLSQVQGGFGNQRGPQQRSWQSFRRRQPNSAARSMSSPGSMEFDCSLNLVLVLDGAIDSDLFFRTYKAAYSLVDELLKPEKIALSVAIVVLNQNRRATVLHNLVSDQDPATVFSVLASASVNQSGSSFSSLHRRLMSFPKNDRNDATAVVLFVGPDSLGEFGRKLAQIGGSGVKIVAAVMAENLLSIDRAGELNAVVNDASHILLTPATHTLTAAVSNC